MPVLREGYLDKEPVQRGLFSRSRRRFFVLTSEPSRIEWYKDERRRTEPKWLAVTQGASITRPEQGLILVSSRNGRPVFLVLHGEQSDLDGWEQALRTASRNAPLATEGSDGSFQSLGPSSFKTQGSTVSSVLGQALPDAPPTPQRMTVALGQSVSIECLGGTAEMQAAGTSLPEAASSSSPQPLVSAAASDGPPPPALDASAAAMVSLASVRLAGGVRFYGFLTHDWGTDELGRDNHGRVAAVKTGLARCGMRCWFDEEQASAAHLLSSHMPHSLHISILADAR